jgi:hypothetical protein
MKLAAVIAIGVAGGLFLFIAGIFTLDELAYQADPCAQLRGRIEESGCALEAYEKKLSELQRKQEEKNSQEKNESALGSP